MITSIGLLELNSIARGVEAADFMVKAAAVDLIYAKAVCPGKYIVLVSGEVAAVKASMDAGMGAGAQHVVDDLVIASVHPQLIPAINACGEVGPVQAVGVMEFFSIASSVIAADRAAKTADITLIEVRLGIGIGGKSFVTLSGQVAAVKESVSAGIAAATEKGMLVASCVIPSPTPELFSKLI